MALSWCFEMTHSVFGCIHGISEYIAFNLVEQYREKQKISLLHKPEILAA